MDDPHPQRLPPTAPVVGDAWQALLKMAGVGIVLVACVAGLVAYGTSERSGWGATGETAAGGGVPSAAVPAPDSPLVSGLPHAELTVRVGPEGATVLVDGDSVGVSPLWQGLVLEGTRWLRVLTPAGEVVVDTMVQVDAAGAVFDLVSPSDAAPDVSRAVPVAPPPPAPPVAAGNDVPPPARRPTEAPPAPLAAREAPARTTGTVEVLVRPWGRIVIDGVALTQETDVVYRAELPAGTHRVEAVHPALGTASRMVTVQAGGRTRVEFDLAEASGPQ